MKRYIIDFSLKNGLGHPAISIYLTGCDNPIKCEDCHNWELQEQSKHNYNINTIKNEIDIEIQNYLQFYNELYIAILGGEPLAKYNKNITLEVSKHIKQKYNNVIVVLYSWRTIEQINNENLKLYIQYIDYGVLGVYDKNLHISDTLPASTNQYIYDFKNNKKLNSIKLKRG
ncbi:MAG: 4Fe-4S cluster-binding domain-containing protein, partial [Bacilli bacterium]